MSSHKTNLSGSVTALLVKVDTNTSNLKLMGRKNNEVVLAHNSYVVAFNESTLKMSNQLNQSLESNIDSLKWRAHLQMQIIK